MATAQATRLQESVGIAGIRPRGVTVDGARGTSVVVALVEPTGADDHSLPDVGGTDTACVVNDLLPFSSKRPLCVSIASPRLCFFDAANVKRLTHASVSPVGVA